MTAPGSTNSGRLYVVATPLGNLEDLSRRALRVLHEVTLIACEDTRRTGNLLRSHGIQTPMSSYFEHNERWKGEGILRQLSAGRDVALVSDAGTPGISDPGFRLVRDARAAGIEVLPIPGPSAVVAALCVSGLATDRFLFVGFLPPRRRARREALLELADRRETLVFYESPQRVLQTLDDMLAVFGEREAFLCREATKVHEEYRRGNLTTLRGLLGERDAVRGEIVLVVAGGERVMPPSTDSAVALHGELVAQGLRPRDAAKEVARRLGLKARDVYRLVLAARPSFDRDVGSA
jgi:16S rRNA (cytidine1402-2'-O)-methyltransferase